MPNYRRVLRRLMARCGNLDTSRVLASQVVAGRLTQRQALQQLADGVSKMPRYQDDSTRTARRLDRLARTGQAYDWRPDDGRNPRLVTEFRATVKAPRRRIPDLDPPPDGRTIGTEELASGERLPLVETGTGIRNRSVQMGRVMRWRRLWKPDGRRPEVFRVLPDGTRQPIETERATRKATERQTVSQAEHLPGFSTGKRRGTGNIGRIQRGRL